MKSATAPKFFGRRRAEQAAYNERSAEADLVEKLGGRNLSRDPIRSIRKVNDARRYVAGSNRYLFVPGSGSKLPDDAVCT